LDCCKPYAVTLDGSKKSRLPLSADSSTTPAWAPDGKRLAVFDEDTTRIRIVRVADGRVEVIFPKTGNGPAWSPDGRTIAFQSYGQDELLRIFLIGANGRGLRQLTKVAGGIEGEADAAWSPDGRSIAFSGDSDGDRDVYVIRADGTGLMKVTDNSVDDASPSWSPDGTRLVFGRTPSDDRTEIVVHALKSGKETIVAAGGHGAGDLVFEPSWQPLKR
jgi:TolB protein